MKTRKELKKLYNTLEFQKEYQYDGKDLGALCTQAGTTFHLWSPLAEEVELRLYRDGKHSECFQKIAMQKEKRGVWSYQTERYLHGVYYDYQIPWDGEIVELGDPYARGCGVNGIRSMVVDLNRTNPLQWEHDQRPKKREENIIYELQIKEFSWDESGGFSKANRGK